MERRFHRICVLAAGAVLAGVVTFAVRAPSSGQTTPYTAYDIAQGQYLVQNVARCVECHGADLGGIAKSATNPNFVPRPKIAGLPMFKQDSDAVAFFTNGTPPPGFPPPRPPMPAYRFKPNDATAIVAYLRSLK